MTKKDYLFIADAYIETVERYMTPTAQQFLVTLIVRMGAENDRFDSYRFTRYIDDKTKPILKAQEQERFDKKYGKYKSR